MKNEKFNFAFVVSSLTDYTNELSRDLVTKAVGKARTLDYINVRSNIKREEAINIIDSTLVVQAGGNCGFTANSTSSFSQVNLGVEQLSILEQLCADQLEDKWVGMYMKPGSYQDELPFAELWFNEKVEKVGKEIDSIIWRGDKTNGTGNLALANGFIKTISGSQASVVTAANVSASAAWTAANIIASVDTMVDGIPADIRDNDDLTLFVSRATFDTYVRACRNANYFHFSPEEMVNGEAMVPGTNVRMVATVGLAGATTLASGPVAILTPASNLYFGTDLVSDFAGFDGWYSRDNQAYRIAMKWKQGVAVAFPEYVVRNGATA